MPKKRKEVKKNSKTQRDKNPVKYNTKRAKIEQVPRTM
jgi:uncharacterized protein YgiM (DUF1202 family)